MVNGFVSAGAAMVTVSSATVQTTLSGTTITLPEPVTQYAPPSAAISAPDVRSCVVPVQSSGTSANTPSAAIAHPMIIVFFIIVPFLRLNYTKILRFTQMPTIQSCKARQSVATH